MVPGTAAGDEGSRAVFDVAAQVGAAKGGGKLTVERGAIVLDTDRLTRALSGVTRIVHTHPSVTLMKARLVPLWFNTAVVLDDGATTCSAVAPGWMRTRIRGALQQNGFDVNEVVTWLSLGGGRARLEATGRPGARVTEHFSYGAKVGLSLLIIAGATAAVLVIDGSPLFIAFAALCAALSLAGLLRQR